jgi:3-oxoacyl-[acyl-carrier protein] reductase
MLKSGFTKEEAKKLYEYYLQVTPLRIIGKPQDIANSVAFLASDDASFITGCCLFADAGLVLSY